MPVGNYIDAGTYIRGYIRERRPTAGIRSRRGGHALDRVAVVINA